MEYLIAAVVLALAAAFVIAGATGNASSLLSAVTGHTITFGSPTAPSTSTSSTGSGVVQAFNNSGVLLDPLT